MDISVRVNGSEEVVGIMTVLELLHRRGLDPAVRGLAVAVNGAVLPRRQWESERLAAGDDIEIVRPFGGG
jgi:sulfur carrier protein